jgi:hypothetical protein
MKVDRTRIIVAFLLVALAFSVLTLLFWDFVRDAIIVPIYYSFWIGGLMLNSLPQEAYLAVLVLISAVIGLNTLARLRIRRDQPDVNFIHAPTETRYLYWKRLSTHLYRSRFSKNLFASEARKLVLTILAHEYRLETAEIDALIRRDALPVPETIRRLIEQGEIQIAEQPSDRLSSLLHQIERLLPQTNTPREPQIDAHLAEIIAFIEQHLEITYVGDPPESRN